MINDHHSRGSENCLPIGTRLSDFEITGVLGEGGFGIVYIAYDHALQRTVAVKEYMPGMLAARAPDHGVTPRAERHRETFATGLKSFINEARLLAQFDHPSLVKVYRFWEQNQTAYTAMQFYEGRTIKEIVADTPEQVTEEWCRKILGQMLAGLEMLYTMNILHRDISPENIIVQENGDAVLLDFGSARQIIGDAKKGLTVILKPGYAPVEQYAGDNAIEQGPWTDIYALSAVMYFAIAGEAPPASIARVMKDSMVPLRERGLERFSPSLLGAIDCGLAMQTTERPRTIDAFRDLLGIVSPGPPPVRPQGAAQRGAPPPRPAAETPTTKPAPSAQAPAAAAPAPAEPQRREQPAAVAQPKSRPRAAWMVGGLAAFVLAAAGFGAYSLLNGASDNTVMIAQPQPAAQHQGAVGREDVAKALDPTETIVEAPAETEPAAQPPISTPAAAGAPAPLPAAAAAKAAAPAVAASVPVSYKLLVKPWGTVYVDGKERGVSPPLKRLLLAPGRHAIRIVNPSFPDYVTTVETGKNKAKSIDHEFPAASR